MVSIKLELSHLDVQNAKNHVILITCADFGEFTNITSHAET